ncbi:MAG: hypothetical protein N3B21_11010 [Clostridia bacterium]|nr:hypothetical protein [Clostridia bacterium]
MDVNNKDKGACIVSFNNGNKECIPETTKQDCVDTCAKTSGANCELSSELTCPRGK